MRSQWDADPANDSGALPTRGAPFGVRRRLLVAQTDEDPEHFAPRRIHPATRLLVVLHRLHEFELGLRVIEVAGGRVNTAAPLAGGLGLRRTSCSVARVAVLPK